MFLYLHRQTNKMYKVMITLEKINWINHILSVVSGISITEIDKSGSYSQHTYEEFTMYHYILKGKSVIRIYEYPDSIELYYDKN